MEENFPFAEEWLAAEQLQGGRVTLQPAPIDEARAQFMGIGASIAQFLPPTSDAVKSYDAKTAQGRRVRIYVPSKSQTAMPVGLYIHSGGWYTGSIDAEDRTVAHNVVDLMRNIAENANIVLFSPDYRLAPENPFPAGLDDCCDAYEWMLENASEHNGSKEPRFIMGGSAGGNLAAAVALKYASSPAMRPSGLIVACIQSCDVNAFPDEYKKRFSPERYTDSPMISRGLMLQATKWYNPPSPADPLYSPLLHPDIRLLPPTYIAATTKDPTHQETVFFYEELKKNGVQADLVEWNGWPHFFWILPMLKGSAEFMDVWNQKLRGLINRP